MTACDFTSIRCFSAARKASRLKRHLGNKSKVHILAGDDRAGGDEARVAPHEFHQADPTWHAPRLRVCAIEYARRFLDRGEKSEGARDKSHVVINGLGHADNRKRVTAIAGFLIKIVCAALSSVAADGEKDVDSAGDEILHRLAHVHRPARGAENRAAGSMNALDELRRDLYRLLATLRIEPAVTAPKAEHLGDAVAVVEFEKERADDVVEPWTQTAAGHDCRRAFASDRKTALPAAPPIRT